MNPKLFGRTLWIIMYEYLFKHKDNIEKIKSFYWLVSEIIPCQTCSLHFRQVLCKNNIMSSTNWDYIFHFTNWLYNSMHVDKIKY